MILAAHEINSPLWQKLQAYYEARIAKHRLRLESKIDEEETIRLRGQIGEIKGFLALAKPALDTTADAD